VAPRKKKTIALVGPATDFRSRVTRLLADADMSVAELEDGPDALTRLGESGADVVVVRRSQLRGRREWLRELTSHAGAPAVIVLSDGDDPVDRARLMAAGVSGVLSEDSDDRTLGEIVEAAADDEGVARRPEVRGAGVEPALADFASRSSRMQEFLSMVERVVDADTSLLVMGETGVGKEHLARAIHNEGPRARHPFVVVNCGALPETLLASELFGHEAGAFTGATGARAGRFEEAGGGTVFLDEIPEMPLHLQVNLLTVLQRHEVRPLGAKAARPVDVRVIAATNRDLAGDVRDGRFREDLYYRLNVMPLEIPPLRERKEDLPEMIGAFLRHLGQRLGREITGASSCALDLLIRHDWPGNVRELRNVLERAVLLSPGPEIEAAAVRDLGAPARPSSPAADEAPHQLPWREAKERALGEFERRYLDGLLRETRGRIGETAKRAGLAPRSIRSKMRRHRLRKEDYRD